VGCTSLDGDKVEGVSRAGGCYLDLESVDANMNDRPGPDELPDDAANHMQPYLGCLHSANSSQPRHCNACMHAG
jgi:hypothetical protein